MQKELTSKEIKKVIFDILCDFQEVCDRNNLHPILAYGTLLGAVRHKGFIPWDDDIDVYLKREEYERLIEIYNKETRNKNYRLVPYVEGSKQYLFVKIIDLRTKIDRPSAFVTEPKYLWIDVFPLDGVPDSNIGEKIRVWKAAMYHAWFGLANTNPNSSSRKGFKGMFNRFWGFFYREIIGTERICRMTIKSAKKLKLEDSSKCFVFTWGLDRERGVFNSTGLDSLVDVEFEGKKFKAMSNWREYLVKLYGEDYMCLPPIEKRISHRMRAWM